MLAFATGNRGLRALADDGLPSEPVRLRAVPAAALDGLFHAVIEATEEAIVNALVAGRTTTGHGGTAHGAPHDRLTQLVARTP
jgi:D-aminopeptidase